MDHQLSYLFDFFNRSIADISRFMFSVCDLNPCFCLFPYISAHLFIPRPTTPFRVLIGLGFVNHRPSTTLAADLPSALPLAQPAIRFLPLPGETNTTRCILSTYRFDISIWPPSKPSQTNTPVYRLPFFQFASVWILKLPCWILPIWLWILYLAWSK